MFAIAHLGNSKPTAVDLFWFVWHISEAIWHILMSNLTFFFRKELATIVHVLGLGA